MYRKMMCLTVEGQGLVEYALMILLVAVAAVAVMTGLGGAITSSLSSNAAAI